MPLYKEATDLLVAKTGQSETSYFFSRDGNGDQPNKFPEVYHSELGLFSEQKISAFIFWL